MKIKHFYVALVISLSTITGIKAESVSYHFDGLNEPGYVASGVPAIVENGALKFTIDDANKSWKVKLRLTVNKDIFAKPVMKIRYKVGTIQAINAGMAVTLKIDDRWTKNGDVGSWRLYPVINQSTNEWQELIVDLKPLIASWESSVTSSHGNIQEIEIVIGTGTAFTGKVFYLDYIKMGETLGVDKVELNPNAPNEVLANMGVPVTGVPTKSNFSVTKNGVLMPLDTVYIRDERNLVIKLKETLDLPRDVMNLPLIKIGYNGNDAIKDAGNSTLDAFQKDLSYASFAESKWRYWGKYENKVKTLSKKQWVSTNTVSEGWDWSLPDFVSAANNANFKYKNNPGINIPQKVWCNNLNGVEIGWDDLEPTPGVYNFEPLRKLITDNSAGYDGVSLRLLAACWEVRSYPVPGGTIPNWLAERKDAPRWMDTMAIAKIPLGNIDGMYQTVNMDIMNPEYHSRYVKFITALGKSGIPEMPQLKIVNVCYRSASAGEEFTAYDAKNNAVEAQYSAEIVDQRTRERLKAWADAFGINKSKLMYVGASEKAQISYAGELGIGTRHGFIEMYNGTVQMSQFGMTINANRYVDLDENNDFIKRDVAFGDENEEYTSELRFGWKESFAYRYYISSFRMLQMRRNYVMHDENSLIPDLTWYVGLGLARRVQDTPDAFCLLSEFYISPFANEGNAGAVKNIERWLYQRDVTGYITTPAMKVPTAKDLWYADSKKPYDFTARKGKKMGFDIDNRMFPAGEQEFAVKVSFYDGVAGTLSLNYENGSGIHTESVVTTGTDKVRTATFFIKSNLAPKDLNFDLELQSEEEVPVFFVRVIKTKELYTSSKAIIQSNNTIRVSPNPFSDYLKLEADNQTNTSYWVTDLLGRKVAEGNTNHATTINTSFWKEGVYFLKTNTSNTYKLIKK